VPAVPAHEADVHVIVITDVSTTEMVSLDAGRSSERPTSIFILSIRASNLDSVLKRSSQRLSIKRVAALHDLDEFRLRRIFDYAECNRDCESVQSIVVRHLRS
jgi:hypothetical protein